MRDDSDTVCGESSVYVEQGFKSEKGHCNSCSVANWDGDKIVYQISIGMSSFRLCRRCLKELKNRITGVTQRG